MKKLLAGFFLFLFVLQPAYSQVVGNITNVFLPWPTNFSEFANQTGINTTVLSDDGGLTTYFDTNGLGSAGSSFQTTIVIQTTIIFTNGDTNVENIVASFTNTAFENISVNSIELPQGGDTITSWSDIDDYIDDIVGRDTTLGIPAVSDYASPFGGNQKPYINFKWLAGQNGITITADTSTVWIDGNVTNSVDSLFPKPGAGKSAVYYRLGDSQNSMVSIVQTNGDPTGYMFYNGTNWDKVAVVAGEATNAVLFAGEPPETYLDATYFTNFSIYDEGVWQRGGFWGFNVGDGISMSFSSLTSEYDGTVYEIPTLIANLTTNPGAFGTTMSNEWTKANTFKDAVYLQKDIYISGNGNSVTGLNASVGTGGTNLTAAGAWSFVGGGQNNAANATRSTVGGGQGNIASGTWGTIGGGNNNRAVDSYDTVAGGNNNQSDGGFAGILGGNGNRALRSYSTVLGGQSVIVSGEYSVAAGKFIDVTNRDSFVFAAGIGLTNRWATKIDNGIIFYDAGTNDMHMGINVDAPTAALHVAGGIIADWIVADGITLESLTTADVQNIISGANFFDLSNVVAVTPLVGQVPKWNGTAWTNAADLTSLGVTNITAITLIEDTSNAWFESGGIGTLYIKTNYSGGGGGAGGITSLLVDASGLTESRVGDIVTMGIAGLNVTSLLASGEALYDHLQFNGTDWIATHELAGDGSALSNLPAANLNAVSNHFAADVAFLSGATFTGSVAGLEPSSASHFATKNYVDNSLASAETTNAVDRLIYPAGVTNQNIVAIDFSDPNSNVSGISITDNVAYLEYNTLPVAFWQNESEPLNGMTQVDSYEPVIIRHQSNGLELSHGTVTISGTNEYVTGTNQLHRPSIEIRRELGISGVENSAPAIAMFNNAVGEASSNQVAFTLNGGFNNGDGYSTWIVGGMPDRDTETGVFDPDAASQDMPFIHGKQEADGVSAAYWIMGFADGKSTQNSGSTMKSYLDLVMSGSSAAGVNINRTASTDGLDFFIWNNESGNDRWFKADVSEEKVGIGRRFVVATAPDYTLDVDGDIGATNFYFKATGTNTTRRFIMDGPDMILTDDSTFTNRYTGTPE